MATTTETYVRNQRYFVNLAELQSDPGQYREYLNLTSLDLNTLSQSNLTSVLDGMTTLKGLLEETLANAPQPKKNLA